MNNKNSKAVAGGGRSSAPKVKTVYIMAITAEEMPNDRLIPVVHIADHRLRAKNPAFARLMTGQMLPKSKIEVANILYAGPIMHTPQAMQQALASWIKKKYSVDYKPVLNQNFFPHGMRDPQGRENYFLFYFDMEAK